MQSTGEEWITTAKAVELMSEAHGRPIRATYVNTLARMGLLKTKPLDGRTKLLYLPDVQRYHVREKSRSEQAV